MSPSLNDLPDVCLLAVFKYISLLELLRTIRLVNTRWSRELLPAEMARRRSLVIVDSRGFDLSRLQLDHYQSHLIEHVKQDDGQTPWSRLPPIDSRNLLNRNDRRQNDAIPFYKQTQSPPEMITTLVDNLPRISQLTVVLSVVNLSNLDQITRMIDHWRDHLVSLKLHLNFHFGFVYGIRLLFPDDHAPQLILRSRIVALFDSINRAQLLKHLTLKMDSLFIRSPFEPPLTILSQLSTLHLESNVLVNYLVNTALVRYASTNRDLKITTRGGHFQLKALLGINGGQFCDRFIGANFRVNGNDPTPALHNLNRFCARFTSLVHLTLVQHNFPMGRLARALSQLSQLVHLSLEVVIDFVPLNAQPLEELAPDQTVPVLSVRLLTLALSIRSHSCTEQLHLPELFPNVQVLSIENVNEHVLQHCLDWLRLQYGSNA